VSPLLSRPRRAIIAMMPTSPSKSSSLTPINKALFAAVVRGDLKAAKAALKAGANPSFYSKRDGSLLMMAAKSAKVELFRILLTAGADPAFRTASRRSALTCALSSREAGVFRIIKLLFELSSPPARAALFDEEPASILHYAVRCGHGSKVCGLLISNGAPVNVFEHGTGTILHFLTSLLPFSDHYQELLSFFIKSGARINAPTVDYRFTPLHTAVMMDNGQAVKQILSAGANPNLADKNGRSLLHCCAVYPASDLVSLVLAHGADPLLRDNLGRSAEELALAEGNFKAHDMLRQHREEERLNKDVARLPPLSTRSRI
jgi:ankyrin repeat protein